MSGCFIPALLSSYYSGTRHKSDNYSQQNAVTAPKVKQDAKEVLEIVY